jgi:hypothetical protein
MKYARDFRYNKLRPDFSDFSVFPVFISLTLFIRVRSIDPVVLKKWQKHPKSGAEKMLVFKFSKRFATGAFISKRMGAVITSGTRQNLSRS